jgi:hypothetical protein
MSAQIKTIRLRMKSIINISKITKAMKMIAATKMRVEMRRMQMCYFKIGVSFLEYLPYQPFLLTRIISKKSIKPQD